jgi:glycosyltransferase involved in cell wall biosynthesis
MGAVMVPLPIALVMTSFEPGGTERQMIELARRLDPARWTVHIVCFKGRGKWFPRAAAAAASVVEFPVTSFKRLATAAQTWAFARWCRANRIAVVHTTELYSNIFGLPGAALAGVPARIGNRREVNPGKSAAQIAMQRAAYTCAHTVVANSRAAADRLAAERVPARRIAVVANGLDFDRIVPHTVGATLRKVVIVANLRPEKGHDVLIDAAVDVLRRVPDATFEIVGDGPQRDALVARAAARGVSGAFAFLGHREDVPSRLDAGDIFVLPSRSDAFPNAVLEAMATGLPIVTSAVGGMLELIEDGRTGLLAPVDDAAALAERLVRLMSDSMLAARLGRAARDEARARYSFDRMVAAFERIYLDQLARGGLPAIEQSRLAAS